MASNFDTEILSAFRTFELRLLDVVQEGPEAMDSFGRDFSQLSQRATIAVHQNVLTLETCKTIRTIASTIRDMSRFLLQPEEHGAQIHDTIRNDWARILDKTGLTKSCLFAKDLNKPKKSKKEEVPSTDTTKYRPCRDYFMANFGYPYPSAASKQAMAEQIGCPVASVNQWFTNYRRRSGWMKVMKDYADNDRAKMRAIIDATLGSSPSSLPEPVVTAVRAVHQYIDRLATPVLSDAFLEALKMEPLSLEELAELKAQRRSARKERVEAKKLESKKKRVAEDRTAKNGHAAMTGTQVAPVVGKRKRNTEDTPPDGDRPMKKRGGPPSNTRPKNPNVHVRIVRDTNGVLRKLRRKVPLQSSTTNGQLQSIPISHSKPITPAPDSSLHVSKRDGKRKAAEDHDTQNPEPRYPTEHKRRRPNPKVVATPSTVNVSSHIPFDPRIVSAPSGMHFHADDTFAPAPEWNHTQRAASLPGNISMSAVPEQSRRLEIFRPDPHSANEFMQFHEPVRLDQALLPLVNISPDLMIPSFDTHFLAAFEFGHAPAGDDHFPTSNESSSSHHAFGAQTSPPRHWSPPSQTPAQRPFSPEAGRAAARVARVEIQRRRLAAEEEVQRLRRLEEEAAEGEDDIAATFVA